MTYGMYFNGSIGRERGDDGRCYHFSSTWATGQMNNRGLGKVVIPID